ncbi:toxin-antitoxin system HicB family antitoxin [Exiguobacterium oxidotolerans]|uniref:toxin-antitoxin system HicB family antitoxin n=1 Tax=Exiguobacterium oxidotolerans TaxID=223958 RepID=UPI000A04B40D|nr:toxin-antitoxin system HicB family antitoxin [Exiguobacterium oxidotolerans]
MEKTNTKRLNLRMPVSIHEWVVKEAAEHGVSATAFISMKLSEVRKRENKEAK